MASWLMRIVSSPGKSSRNRWAICSGLHALAHCRFFRCPCRRPFQGTTGPRTAAPPEVATTPASRSCTYVCSAALVVHPLSYCGIWHDGDPGAARGAVPPSMAPDERMLVRVPVGGGAPDG